MTAANPERRSIWERLAEKKGEVHPLADIDLAPLDESTSTFRIEHTGQLVLDDSAASIAAPVDANQPLGELDAVTAAAYHLLVLPPGRRGEEVEALAISVWNEAGWINPGVLHLTEGVTLEGPWQVSEATHLDLGLQGDNESVWLLRCQPVRGAAPTEEVMAREELARAFPAGMPVGVELGALSVLRRVARRLGGQLRIAGSGQVLVPDPGSAVNLRVYTAEPAGQDEVLAALSERFPEVELVTPALEGQGPSPYALLIKVGAASQVLVGLRLVTQIPRALRWESWVRQDVFVYEVNWANLIQQTLPNGQLTRVGRRERALVSAAISGAAATLASLMRDVAVVDEDDFLVALDELESPTEN
ncbi:hypothetical protein [Scrofimicrobium sp. R131]|uniref:Uncharacterized protein n=1 Tax=Scrofimicrobium appendicitidis TaxID=3079930 RepID=A0AAU7V7C2_9ACTO